MKDLRKALCFGVLAVALIVLSERVAAPLHAAGKFQAPLGYFMGAVHFLNLPGIVAAQAMVSHPHARWGANFVFWGVGGSRRLWCFGADRARRGRWLSCMRIRNGEGARAGFRDAA